MVTNLPVRATPPRKPRAPRSKNGKGESRERLEIHSTPTGKKIRQSVPAEQTELISAAGIFSLGEVFFSPLHHLIYHGVDEGSDQNVSA